MPEDPILSSAPISGLGLHESTGQRRRRRLWEFLSKMAASIATLGAITGGIYWLVNDRLSNRYDALERDSNLKVTAAETSKQTADRAAKEEKDRGERLTNENKELRTKLETAERTAAELRTTKENLEAQERDRAADLKAASAAKRFLPPFPQESIFFLGENPVLPRSAPLGITSLRDVSFVPPGGNWQKASVAAWPLVPLEVEGADEGKPWWDNKNGLLNNGIRDEWLKWTVIWRKEGAAKMIVGRTVSKQPGSGATAPVTKETLDVTIPAEIFFWHLSPDLIAPKAAEFKRKLNAGEMPWHKASVIQELIYELTKGFLPFGTADDPPHAPFTQQVGDLSNWRYDFPVTVKDEPRSVGEQHRYFQETLVLRCQSGFMVVVLRCVYDPSPPTTDLSTQRLPREMNDLMTTLRLRRAPPIMP